MCVPRIFGLGFSLFVTACLATDVTGIYTNMSLTLFNISVYYNFNNKFCKRVAIKITESVGSFSKSEVLQISK